MPICFLNIQKMPKHNLFLQKVSILFFIAMQFNLIGLQNGNFLVPSKGSFHETKTKKKIKKNKKKRSNLKVLQAIYHQGGGEKKQITKIFLKFYVAIHRQHTFSTFVKKIKRLIINRPRFELLDVHIDHIASATPPRHLLPVKESPKYINKRWIPSTDFTRKPWNMVLALIELYVSGDHLGKF
nr:hypothetical protein C53C7.2 - Caenorhabditis elegans [Caenorhabditis elegans]